MAQMGFFDLSDRYVSLDAKKDPLLEIDAVVPWEQFRPALDWLEANPGKTSGDYACEVAELTSEVMYEVLAGMPMEIQLSEWAVPACEKEAMQKYPPPRLDLVRQRSVRRDLRSRLL